MSNHRARTWDHRRSKHLDLKLLPLGHHLDGLKLFFLNHDSESYWIIYKWGKQTQKNKNPTTCFPLAQSRMIGWSSVLSLLGCFLGFEPSDKNTWKKLEILFERKETRMVLFDLLFPNGLYFSWSIFNCWWEKPLVMALEHLKGIKHTVLFQNNKLTKYKQKLLIHMSHGCGVATKIYISHFKSKM